MARATKGSDDLGASELRAGVPRVGRLVAEAAPRFMAYTGKGVYLAVARRTTAPWGLQAEGVFGPARDVVLPSPSGRVRMTFEEKLEFYRQLAVLVGRGP